MTQRGQNEVLSEERLRELRDYYEAIDEANKEWSACKAVDERDTVIALDELLRRRADSAAGGAKRTADQAPTPDDADWRGWVLAFDVIDLRWVNVMWDSVRKFPARFVEWQRLPVPLKEWHKRSPLTRRGRGGNE